MEAPKEFGKVVISLENSILPLEVLENTPSRKDGISESLETDLRMVGCDYIQSAGILLKLPQVRQSYSSIGMVWYHYYTGEATSGLLLRFPVEVLIARLS